MFIFDCSAYFPLKQDFLFVCDCFYFLLVVVFELENNNYFVCCLLENMSYPKRLSYLFTLLFVVVLSQTKLLNWF